MEQEKKVKKLVEKANETCFITCTELPKYKVVIYVTENTIMIRDNEVMGNSVLIPIDEFVSRRDELIAKQIEEDAKRPNSQPTSTPVVNTGAEMQS